MKSRILSLIFFLFGCMNLLALEVQVSCSSVAANADTIKITEPLGSNYQYSVDNGVFQASPSLLVNDPGRYSVVVENTDDNSKDTVYVNVLCDLEPFDCSDCNLDGLYQVFDGDLTGEGTIASIDLLNNQFTELPNSNATISINGVGMNPSDNLAYGFLYGTNRMVVIDANGTVIPFTNPVVDLPPVSAFTPYQTGDFGPDGNLYVKTKNGMSMFIIDVDLQRVVGGLPLSPVPATNDIAYNSTGQVFYSLNQSQTDNTFIIIDANTGIVTTVGGPIVFQGTQYTGAFGAMYSDISGRAWGVHNSTGDLLEFDVLTGLPSLTGQVGSSDQANRNDGFSCQNVLSILSDACCPLEPAITGLEPQYCVDDTLFIEVTGGATLDFYLNGDSLYNSTLPFSIDIPLIDFSLTYGSGVHELCFVLFDENELCQDTICTEITITEDLSVQIAASEPILCEDEDLTLTAFPLGAMNYEWTYVDVNGAPPTVVQSSSDPSLTVNAPGVYIVYVEDPANVMCGGVDSIIVEEEPCPTSCNVNVQIDGISPTYCIDDTIVGQFSGADSGLVFLNGEFFDSHALPYNFQFPILFLAEEGPSFELCLVGLETIDDGSICVDTTCVYFEIEDGPVVDVIGDSICIGGSTTLSAVPDYYPNYIWSILEFNSGVPTITEVQNGSLSTYVASQPGVYLVEVDGVLGGCPGMSGTDVIVDSSCTQTSPCDSFQLEADFTIEATGNLNEYEFVNTSTIASGLEWTYIEWEFDSVYAISFPPGNVSDTTYQFPDSPPHNVCLTVNYIDPVTGYCCKDKICKPINPGFCDTLDVGVVVNADKDILEDPSGLTYDLNSVTFTDPLNPTPFIVEQVRWSLGDGRMLIGDSINNVSYNEEGMYIVCAFVTFHLPGVPDRCCIVEDCVELCVGNGSHNSESGDGQQNPDESIELDIPITEEEISAFNVFPNPGRGVYQVEIENISDSDRYLEVIDLNGRVIMKKLSPSAYETVDLSLFENGVYIFRVVYNEGFLMKKIIKL